MLKAHKLLWAIIVSGNIDLVRNENLPYQIFEEGHLKSYRIREICLSDQDCFLQTVVSEDNVIECLVIKFYTKKMDYFENIKEYFGEENIYKLPFSAHTLKDIVDKPSHYYLIEFPNFEVPMTICVKHLGTNPYTGKICDVKIYIPKSGKFESIKDVDPGSRIQVIPMKPIIRYD